MIGQLELLSHAFPVGIQGLSNNTFICQRLFPDLSFLIFGQGNTLQYLHSGSLVTFMTEKNDGRNSNYNSRYVYFSFVFSNC